MLLSYCCVDKSLVDASFAPSYVVNGSGLCVVLIGRLLAEDDV